MRKARVNLEPPFDTASSRSLLLCSGWQGALSWASLSAWYALVLQSGDGGYLSRYRRPSHP